MIAGSYTYDMPRPAELHIPAEYRYSCAYFFLQLNRVDLIAEAFIKGHITELHASSIESIRVNQTDYEYKYDKVSRLLSRVIQCGITIISTETVAPLEFLLFCKEQGYIVLVMGENKYLRYVNFDNTGCINYEIIRLNLQIMSPMLLKYRIIELDGANIKRVNGKKLKGIKLLKELLRAYTCPVDPLVFRYEELILRAPEQNISTLRRRR